MQISQKFESIIKDSNLYDPMRKIVISRGQEVNPEFVFIGDAPGKIDDKEGKPFVGEVGKMLDNWIAMSFVSSFCVTNVVPLMPLDKDGEVRSPTKEEINYFQFFVDWVIETVNPKYIVAMGSGACYGLFGKEVFGKVQMFGNKRGIAISDGADENELAKAILSVREEKKSSIDVEEKVADIAGDSDDEEDGEEATKEIEYAESIVIPKQRVRNEAVKYMINEQLAFFRIAAQMIGAEFKDIDSKEYFHWNGIKFFSYMKSSTQGRDLIVFKAPTSKEVAILYETPTNYELVGVVTGEEVRTAEVRAIPGAGDVKYISFMNFHPIEKFFKLKRVKSKSGDEKATKVQRYFPLHVHTEYSIGDGANKTEDLAKILSKMGFLGAAVSDHGHMNGTYYFQKDLGAKGLKTVLGVEMYIYDEEEFPKAIKKEKKGDEEKAEKAEKKHRYHITLYAKNAKGWANLLELMWIACTEGFYYKPRILLKHLFAYKEGIIATSGCLDGFLMFHCRKLEMDKAMKYAELFKKEFGDDYYAEIMPHHEIQGFVETTNSVLDIAKNVGIKRVVSLDSHYCEEKDKSIHNAVLAINRRQKIEDSGYTGNTYYIMDDDELGVMLNEKFNIPASEIEEMFKNTLEIADKCDYRIEKFKAETTMPFDENSKQLFKEVLETEFAKRPFKDNPVYRERLDFEMGRILTKGYDGYFLMVKDIIDTAKSLNVMYGPGRGSVAGSLVAYLMGMHSVDPVEHDLLFDRFISDMRKDMPDVDMDFQDSGRKKLIAKLIEKYGEDRVCGIMAFSKMHGKGAIRDTGRICSIDRSDCEKVASLVVTRSGGDARQNFSLEDTFEEFEGAKEFKNKYPKESDIAIGIEGRIRHCTKHAAGLVITREPVRKYVPVFRVNGEIVTGWEKKAVEELGIVKMDVLGLKALDVVARSVEKTGAILPDKYNDPKVYDTVFRIGNTAGIFQFESQGLTKYVKDMECDNFNSLTDATSLYRPGPLHSGMAMIYLQRKKGLKPIEHEHEKLRLITKDTYGIMIYQEQIMRIMHDIGGFTWSTSEMIRKVISKSMGKSLFEELQDKFVKHAVETLGMSVKDAEKIYNATSMFGCLTGDTKIYRCSSNQHTGRELTIKEAFEYQDDINFRTRGLKILSMSYDGFVRYNGIKKIWCTGQKDVYYIRTASNKTIKASAEHRFLVNNKWQKVEDFSVGDWIRTSELELPKKLYGEGIGSGPKDGMTPRRREGKGYTNEKKHQKKKLMDRHDGKCQICGSEKFVEMHHKDGDHHNNSDSNTMLLCRKHHKRQYLKELYKRFVVGYPTQNEQIVEIKLIGKRETYDMEMADEPRNFIANGFVSHNSYGFNRSHGASYSVLSYWMAFLKTYHPEIFFSVLLDRENDPEMAKRYVENAKKMGVSVLPPDINKSEAGYSMVPDSKVVICGVQAIKGIGAVAVKSVIKGRPYNSVQDMVKGLKKNIFKVIVQSGSADYLLPSRKWCLDNVEEMYLKKYDFSKVPKKAKELDEKEKMIKQNDVLDFHMDKHISSYFTDPFGDKIKYERIADMKFESYVTERWIKGAVNFINFKQEGLEGNWMLFQDGVLERKYAHLNVNDASGGNVLVHISPEQYTYYKRTLERKKFPVIVKGHTIPEYQKLYCDALIILDDINKENPIFDYVSGVSARKAKAIKRRTIEARQKNVYVGVLVGATYKVKDKRAFVRLVFADGGVYFTDEITPGQIYVAGNVIKGKLVSRRSLGEIEVF